MFTTIVPLNVKQAIHRAVQPSDRAWRIHLLRAELRRIGDGRPSRRRMGRLARGWSSDGWGADADYLMMVAEHAGRTELPILECGSGISTLVAAAYGSQRVWSLEHQPGWKAKVQALADELGLAATVSYAPLMEYENGFDWYQLPQELPRAFGLVVCDGPPGDTRGGRYGLLPVASDRIAGATVLLDDAHRPSEKVAINRWCEEFGVTAMMNGGRHAILRVPLQPPAAGG